MHKQQGWLQAWEYCQASWFKHLWERHKEWTEAGVSASRVTTLRRLQEKGYQATSEPETTSEASYLGCGEKELDCCSVVQSPLFLPCHLLVLVHCVFWVHSQRSHLPGNFRALHASFCWQALWRCWFHFPAGLGTCPHCQKHQKLVKWPWCWCAWLASNLAWPEPHRESIGYCQEEDERPNNAETWTSIPPQQCHKLITSMPRRIEAVIKAKGAPTKYWVHIQ